MMSEPLPPGFELDLPIRSRLRWVLPVMGLLATPWLACAPKAGDSPIQVSSVRHLDLEFETAAVENDPARAAAASSMTWDLSDSETPWQTLSASVRPTLANVTRTRLADGIRLELTMPDQRQTLLMVAGVSIELSELRLGDWEAVEVRARTEDRFGGITLAYNYEERGALPNDMAFFFSSDEVPPIFSDGSEQIYSIPIRPRKGHDGETSLESLAVVISGPDPGALDLLSIHLVPRGARYSESAGVQTVYRDGITRQTVFAIAPSQIQYTLDVPEGGRFDFGLSIEGSDSVTYEVRAGEPGTNGESLWTETIRDAESWQQRSIDLSAYAGKTIELTLASNADAPRAVALWGSPIVSGSGKPPLPNVIFYVIDGAGADFMSVYDYERPTTPFLEELAAEGAIFGRAHSNSTWTQPSTASFMTSLQHSVLGGLRRGVHSTPIPQSATTMAEHMRSAGYVTASFTTNPNAGRIIANEQGVDLSSDGNSSHHSTSSVELHERFWEFRKSYPSTPYWVHFQTTDVHEPNAPAPPYAGQFADDGATQRVTQWDQRIFQTSWQDFGQGSVQAFYDLALERSEIDRKDYFTTRNALYDETMLHQDEQLRRLVDRLKKAGEWEHTLLIIGSDHGHPAGTFARFGRGLLDPQPEAWQGALFDAYATRVPLLFVWPQRIEGDLLFDTPVSMIDVLPTLLELIGLPPAEVAQGQSLAPLLQGEEMEVRPVILDEFRMEDTTHEMVGNLEIIDGRWGASLEIGPRPPGAPTDRGRHVVPVGGRWGARHEYYDAPPRVLLYDLEADPFATRAVNDEHPELVNEYTKLLLEQWKAHQALATQFEEATQITLDPEQLEQLKALGYIQ